MTELRIGVVDVLVLRRTGAEWRVLVVQRSQGTRCPGSWETIHGRIEPGEEPEAAAVRELREETGLEVERLYNVTVHGFYLHDSRTVQLAIVFAAVVREPGEVTLGAEHVASEWLSVEEARERFAWPRERSALRDAMELLRAGDAGAVEDVLRVF